MASKQNSIERSGTWLTNEASVRPKPSRAADLNPMGRYKPVSKTDAPATAGITHKDFRGKYTRKAMWSPTIDRVFHPLDAKLREVSLANRQDLQATKVQYGVTGRKTWWNPFLESKSHVKVRNGLHVRSRLAARDLAVAGLVVYVGAAISGHASPSNIPHDIEQDISGFANAVGDIVLNHPNSSAAESTQGNNSLINLQFAAGHLTVQPTINTIATPFDPSIAATPSFPIANQL